MWPGWGLNQDNEIRDNGLNQDKNKDNEIVVETMTFPFWQRSRQLWHTLHAINILDYLNSYISSRTNSKYSTLTICQYFTSKTYSIFC